MLRFHLSSFVCVKFCRILSPVWVCVATTTVKIIPQNPLVSESYHLKARKAPSLLLRSISSIDYRGPSALPPPPGHIPTHLSRLGDPRQGLCGLSFLVCKMGNSSQQSPPSSINASCQYSFQKLVRKELRPPRQRCWPQITPRARGTAEVGTQAGGLQQAPSTRPATTHCRLTPQILLSHG